MLLYNTILVLAVILILGWTNAQDAPTIKLNAGEVRGHYKKSYNGRTFAAFEGIPYAKAPLGNLRFAEAQPAEPWAGVLNATKIHTCIQLGWFTNSVIGDEDCLYINVYVPREQPKPNENLDVVVHIHGGAFMLGDPELGGPDFLMDRDIVYVNLNYRLGVLGFLTTEDDVVPGNNGMKDQVSALRWIQENIAKFGGNPSSVTITGVSGGGASVHLHYFSPLSKGLFHGGLSHSGVGTPSWATQKAPLRRTRAIANTVGCNQVSTAELVECLRRSSAAELVDNVKKLQIIPGFPIVMFGPTIEDESSTAFLTEHPIKLLEAGKVHDVPWISAICTGEGTLALPIILAAADYVESNWNALAPSLLEYDVAVPQADQASISKTIKERYFGDQKIGPETTPQIIQLFSDRYFERDFGRASHLQSKANKSPVYSYVYDYKASVAPPEIPVGHGEDGYLLYDVKIEGVSLISGNLSVSDVAMKEFFVNMLISLTKIGKPEVAGVPWEPVSGADEFGYLFIKGPGDMEMVRDNGIGSADFWESLSINEDDKFPSP